MSAFAGAELQLTRMLAHILEIKDFEKLDLLIGRADVRVKCKIIKNASKKYCIVGQNILDRICYFSDKPTKLRHYCAHWVPLLDGDNIQFSSVGKLPKGYESSWRPSNDSPITYQLDKLIEYAHWLRLFEEDANDAIVSHFNGGPLEIITPRSIAP